MFRHSDGERPTLTIELIREGPKLVRKYYVPGSTALKRMRIVDEERDIGTHCAYGGLRGIDAVRAVLVETSGEELRQNLSGDRLDGVGHLLFDVLFGIQAAPGRDRDLKEILRATFKEQDSDRSPSPRDKPLRVRILAREYDLAALPWQATMWRTSVLTQWPNPWTFEIVSKVEMMEEHLLNLPARILIIAPILPRATTESANGLAGTSMRHVSALEAFFKRMHPSNDVRITWTIWETKKLLESFTPHVVYFFGHGEVDVKDRKLKLVFADDKEVVRDVAAWFKTPHQSVYVLFVNACLSGQAGWHSAWSQMRDVAPVVISNVMDVFAERAASYAYTFFMQWWERLLDPVEAANVQPNQTNDIFGWATAITHTTYKSFVVERPPLEKLYGDDAEFWCDRDTQRAIAYKHVSDLCKAPNQRVEAIICCGTPTSHVDKIARQCIDYIHSETTNIRIKRHTVRMPLQRAPEVGSAHFELQLKMDFGFGMEKDLRALLSANAPRVMGHAHRVLWLDWGVLKNQKKYSKDVEAWLVFVRDIVARACPPEIRIITSLHVEEARDVVVKLMEKIDKYLENEDLSTRDFGFIKLAPLDDIVRLDIMKFLRLHDCEKVDKVSRAIYGRTAGNYAETVHWLRVGLTEGWPVVLDRLRDTSQRIEDKDDDI